MQDGKTKPSDGAAAGKPGLCGDCAHAQRINSDRGSIFFQCQLSFSDPRFAKYPRLPVLTCSGYKKQQVAVDGH
jgi:hypothetical protein